MANPIVSLTIYQITPPRGQKKKFATAKTFGLPTAGSTVVSHKDLQNFIDPSIYDATYGVLQVPTGLTGQTTNYVTRITVAALITAVNT